MSTPEGEPWISTHFVKRAGGSLATRFGLRQNGLAYFAPSGEGEKASKLHRRSVPKPTLCETWAKRRSFPVGPEADVTPNYRKCCRLVRTGPLVPPTVVADRGRLTAYSERGALSCRLLPDNTSIPCATFFRSAAQQRRGNPSRFHRPICFGDV
jgi:hypothetical protein